MSGPIPKRAGSAAVDIVVPVHNEERDLERSVRRLHEFLGDGFPMSWSITVAENASTDRSWSIARRLTEELENVDAIRLDEKGRGRAVRAAWMSSPSAVLVYMDVDLSTGLEALLPLVAPLISGEHDIAIGSRRVAGSQVVRGMRREGISRLYNLLVRSILRAGFTDAQCGFKAIRSDVARELLPRVQDESWFFDTELLVLAEREGYLVHEVPVEWIDDPRSSVDVVSTSIRAARGMWRMSRGRRPPAG
jgi:glycosyltransferase involved in cell wall biosynthesis